jgi:hypothetical protein
MWTCGSLVFPGRLHWPPTAGTSQHATSRWPVFSPLWANNGNYDNGLLNVIDHAAAGMRCLQLTCCALDHYVWSLRGHMSTSAVRTQALKIYRGSAGGSLAAARAVVQHRLPMAASIAGAVLPASRCPEYLSMPLLLPHSSA